jgi:hypothetical protein
MLHPVSKDSVGACGSVEAGASLGGASFAGGGGVGVGSSRGGEVTARSGRAGERDRSAAPNAVPPGRTDGSGVFSLEVDVIFGSVGLVAPSAGVP